MNTRGCFLTAGLLILLLVAFTQEALGQNAQLSGIITDDNSALIVGARLTLTKVDTGVTRQAVTNKDGYYSIPFVSPGSYELNVLADGFRPVTRNNVNLNVDQAARIDFILEIGTLNESVNITASDPPLERETSSIGQVIENKSIVTLPLNGRNYAQLVLLMPGAIPNQGSRTTDGFSLNGNRTLQNKFLVDGLDNNNYITGIDTGSTQAIRPSVDAIQEFRVESANYNVQYGQAAGGVISVAIKSGTNSLHGSAFEFLRNEKLDANDFFANRAGLKRGPFRFNQFGGTLGGPVWRNRTFFFASFQGTRTRASNISVVTVPTAEQVGGNFGSVNIFDPANLVGGTRQQFPNNVIPVGRLDSVGRKIAALFPAPNQPGLVNNYASLVPQIDDANQYDYRGDHNFSERDKLFARFSKLNRNILRGSICPAPGNCGLQMTLPLSVTNDAWSVAAGQTHIFSANAVNEFRLGYSNNQSFQQSPAEKPLFDDFGIKGVAQFNSLTGLPQFNLTNYSGLGNRIQTPNPKEAKLFQINDNFSYLRGRHTMNLGGEYWRLSTFVGTANTARGSFDFTGQFTSRTPGQATGNAVADLLLGLTGSATITTAQLATFLVDYYGGYFSDSWTLSPKLTLNFGVRYELQTRQREKDNRQAFFDYTPGSPTYGTLVQARDGGHRERTFSNLDKNNFAPRVGFAWQLDQKTVLRGGFGVFYSGVGYYAGNFSGAANLPFFVRIAINSPTTAANTSLKLSNGFPSGVLNPALAVNPAVFGQPRDFPIGEVYQGSIDLQRELWGGLVLSVAYVGSGSAKLSGLNDINAPKPGPGAAQPRRLFSALGAINTLSGFAHASYHSLQSKLERRFQSGLSLLSSYTWSHAIDNSTDGEDNNNGPNIPQDSSNTNAEKASSGFDIRHRFVTSVVYDLPFGRAGGHFEGSKLVRVMFGGFQLAGIFVAQTGQPVNPDVAGNPANTTNPGRPNRLLDGNLSGSERNVDRWFNPAAFAAPVAFTYGSSGRNVLRAPGFVNLDLLVARSFRLTETVHLELRGEFFNLSNTTHFGKPNATVGSPQFGHITATAAPNRQVQVGVRLAF
ncbi:MAG TPA: TonB-dependent receptor [Pyrinomonadaceae bacterium]